MSMPEFPKPNPELTQEQALTMILSSIALEEVALSHIINAEGEKIQHILKQVPCGGHPADLQDILAVNQSVATLLEMVLQNQMILKNKLDKVLEYLPKPPRPPEPPYPPYPPGPPCPPYPPHPPHPPCPPEPPRPPVLPCMTPGCCPFGQGCLGVAPKTYCCHEFLQWKEYNTWGQLTLVPGDCTHIQLPYAGSFVFGLCMDIGSGFCGELELIISCQERAPMVKKIQLNPCSYSTVLYQECTIQLPGSCAPCYASVRVCAPGGLHVRQGRLTITKE